MCAGALLLFGWSVTNYGFHELEARGVEQFRIGVGIGLAIPLAVAGFLQVWRLKNAVLRQTESAFGNAGAILSMAFLLALVNSIGI